MSAETGRWIEREFFEREPLICSRELIANNVFTDCGNEDWGCVGVLAGYGPPR